MKRMRSANGYEPATCEAGGTASSSGPLESVLCADRDRAGGAASGGVVGVAGAEEAFEAGREGAEGLGDDVLVGAAGALSFAGAAGDEALVELAAGAMFGAGREGAAERVAAD